MEALLDGPRRFGELSETIAGIAPNVLAARLRKLEAERIVVSVPYSTRPVRHTYELTADGRELAGALAVLGAWAVRVEGVQPGVPYHERCGTASSCAPGARPAASRSTTPTPVTSTGCEPSPWVCDPRGER